MTAPAYRPLTSDTIERRDYEYTPFPVQAGRSFYLITCPFCETLIKAFPWSLAGSGKRCECGAMHSWYGTDKAKP